MTARRRLLFLSHVLPYPPDSGVTSRTFNTIRQLQRSFDVTLLMFSRRNHQAGAPARQAAEDALRAEVTTLAPAVPIASQSSKSRLLWDHLRSVLAGRAYTYFTFDSATFGAQLDRVLRDTPPDLSHLDSLDLHRWLGALPDVPITATHHDLESVWLQRRAEKTRSPFLRRYIEVQARLAERTERRLCPQLSANLVMSALDAERLESIAPGSRTMIVPNGVDTDFFAVREEQPVADRVVFIGPTYVFPNRDAVEHLLRDIWPRVRRARPTATLHLIGGGPAEQLARYGREDGVTSLGRVDDLRAHVGAACCSVVPIRVGGGTRIKILESWSMGRPVVSTTLGCEGLSALDGIHLLVRDDPGAFADAILELLGDQQRRKKIATEARCLAEAQYSWNRVGRDLCRDYSALIEHDQASVETAGAARERAAKRLR